MRKSLALLLISFVCFSTSPAGAAKPKAEKPPVLVVFGFTQSGGAPVGLEITVAVLDQVAKSRRFDIMTFNPDMPAITRAILEHRLSEETLNDAWNPKNAAVIAGVLNAQYALCIKGSALSENATVTLDLMKVSGGSHWTATAESAIAANEGSRQTVTRKNAISTAGSSAVSQIMLQAFESTEPLLPERPSVQPEPATAPAVSETPTPEPAVSVEPPPITTPTPAPTEKPAEPASGGPKPAPAQAPTPPETRDIAAEYGSVIKQVDADAGKGDLRAAIFGLRRAINLMPTDPKPRLRIAGMYTDLGMTAEAIDECTRALDVAGNNAEIRKLLVRLYLAAGAYDKAADQCREIVRFDPKNLEAQISLGDILWNQAKIDEALHVYQDAVKLDSANMTARGRLQKLYAARKMYPQAIEQLLAMKVPSADAEPDAGKRYAALAKVIRDEFGAVRDLLASARKDFDQGNITREEYYQESKDMVGRIEALAGHLSTQTAPSEYREAHSHGVLATSLLTQAGGYVVSYLETEKQYYRDQASLLLAEANAEMDTYAKAVMKS